MKDPAMSHALIIDDNMAVGRALQNRLSAFGFDSFDHTWTEQQAFEAASQRRPDLIVVGDHLASGSPIGVARELASTMDAPILAVTTGRFSVQRAVASGATVEGPYPLSQLDVALASAASADVYPTEA
jgi:DNA-binding response OmpR family regulator